MAGNKNSGMRPLSVRERRLRTIDRAWLKAAEQIDGKDLKPQQAEMVKAIVVKSIPEQVEQSGEVTVRHIVTHTDIEERVKCYSKH
jgi:hypothetical protein